MGNVVKKSWKEESHFAHVLYILWRSIIQAAMDRQREIEGERAKCRTLFLLRLASSLFALLSPFLPPSLFPSDLAALSVFPPFCNSRRPSVRPAGAKNAASRRPLFLGERPAAASAAPN